MYFDNTWLTYCLILMIIASSISLFVNILYTHFLNQERKKLIAMVIEMKEEFHELEIERNHLKNLQNNYQNLIEDIVFKE